MKGAKTYIQVILPVRFRDTVTYSVPDELVPKIQIGSRVEVMLGYRKYKGYVEEISQTPRYDIRKIRDILSIDTEITATPEDIRFWRTIADYYMCSSGEALKAATPFLMELLTKREKKSAESLPKTDTKACKCAAAAKKPDILVSKTTEWMAAATEASTSDTQTGKSVPENPETATLGTKNAHSVPKFLKSPQDPAIKNGLYLDLVSRQVQRGKSTLILTPDIASCRKMEKALSPHFGDKIITYHSGQTTAKKREATKALLTGNGEASHPASEGTCHTIGTYTDTICSTRGDHHSPLIIIGLRSALFLPFRNLGLIIVDEEHSPLYKQSEPTPRYHGRDTALILAQLHNADIILSSPTPSFESLHNVMIGKYQELSLPQELLADHPNDATESLKIVDFSKEFRTGSTKGALTNIALAALRERAAKGIKTAIFRPKWAFPQAEQEWRPELEDALEGIKTEIFTEIQQLESLKAKPSFIVVIQGEALLSPKNFRAEERALQQIMKIVEIAKSGKSEGQVIVQTSLYRHNIFKHLCGKVPFETLLQERAELNLPPFSRIIQITMHCDSFQKMEQKGEEVTKAIKMSGATDFDGPIPISEESCMFQIRLHKNKGAQKIKRQLSSALYYFENVIIDVDPL
ncbi:MAG: hypothetical protein J6S16_01900 [Bacteroidales bacterium]|nr:hypothetical protein [Bacteroidales bacterium]MBO7763672.1 hypothetical protein [Bacteroidales bacterium]